MHQAVEKLKTEKEKLTSEFKETRNEYRAEIKRINKAIRSFSVGFAALGGMKFENPPKRGMTHAIEKILAGGAKRIREIIDELTKFGYHQIQYQSVSGLMQANAKAGKKFIKVAPATFALLPEKENTGEKEITGEPKNETSKSRKEKNVDASFERTVVYEETTATGGGDEFADVF